jgi:iron-sulfur cluster assembly accessory protein|tara:strand:- start:797 stop:1222 length:426 start_codon:yes stop_codon:yes gene_type:complete
MTGDLSQKLLYDFHGNAPTIDESQTALPTITKKAAIYIGSVLEEGQMFRFGIDGGGCSGFQYLFDVANSRDFNDICFSTEPVAIIDNESLTYLRGSVIDLDDSGLNKQLKVNNPGAKMSCGCGTSFAYDDAYWEQMMAQEG